MAQIIKTSEELLMLDPVEVKGLLSSFEILHIFKAFNGFWSYDYEAAKEGRPGLHAELKSKQHSDGFLFSKAALRYFNICRIMAKQLCFDGVL